MIKPTVGRKVWYRPGSGDVGCRIGELPWDATIIGVHSDRLVNLRITDAAGATRGKTSVVLLQDDEKRPGSGYFAEWMPYQIGQAAKTEAVEAKLTAPCVTTADIEANIVEERYFTAWDGAQLAYWAECNPENPKSEEGSPKKNGPLSLLTFCVLVLRNGFTVTGESACASPENFDAEKGRKYAREKAIDNVWPLMGYELRSKLAQFQNG